MSDNATKLLHMQRDAKHQIAATQILEIKEHVDIMAARITDGAVPNSSSAAYIAQLAAALNGTLETLHVLGHIADLKN
jgi:hypothetical protein